MRRSTIVRSLRLWPVAPTIIRHQLAVPNKIAAGTTIQDSGLFGHILPLFKNKTGIEVKVVAQGTGQALDTARRGNADVVFVHDKVHEKKFVAEGHGVRRFDVMCNYFVLS